VDFALQFSIDGCVVMASRVVSRKKKIETSWLGQHLSNPFAQIVRQ
jgi:hypothetical protein